MILVELVESWALVEKIKTVENKQCVNQLWTSVGNFEPAKLAHEITV